MIMYICKETEELYVHNKFIIKILFSVRLISVHGSLDTEYLHS